MLIIASGARNDGTCPGEMSKTWRIGTAMPLCHWPFSCYPNHALDQADDWMAEIYERWVAAHGW